MNSVTTSFTNNYENIYRVKVIGRMAGGELDQAITAAPMAQAMIERLSGSFESYQSQGYGRLADRIRGQKVQ